MSKPQRHWDARAAFNFILGGSGAGLMAASVAIEPASPWPLALALALIAAGLAAVWLEIGRKARALHVFFNPFTSWMTRESFAALILFPLALGSMLTLSFVPAAALAALAFLWCQARILRAARVFVDDPIQALHSGEINVPTRDGLYRPDELAGTLGEVVAGKKQVRRGAGPTVFDSTGLAIQDIACAKVVLEEARARGLGSPFDFAG